VRRLSPGPAVFAVVFANAIVWALVTPAFQGPDEQAHVAYAVHLAETGKTPRSGSHRPPFSSEMVLALQRTHHYSVIQYPEARPPWRRADERLYERVVAEREPARDDDGGDSVAAVHGPVYYALPALAYRVAGGSFFERLFAMRIASALLAALTALFVYGTVRELLPRERWAAVAGGLLVGFQPMFGFVSGTVNADVGVNLAGAALLYLLIRALRRGLTPALAAAIPVTFVLGVLAKATMIAFAPVAALALLVVAWRRAASARAWLALVGALTAIVAAWAMLAAVLDRPLLPLPPEAGPGSERVGIGGSLSYLWQVFLPHLPFMHDIYQGPDGVPAWAVYVERAWGVFGWVAIKLPAWAFYLIAAGMALALALALRAGVRYRAALRARAVELAVLALGFASVAVLAHLAFVHVTTTSIIEEQGRYLFPAATAAAVLAVGACYGLGRRLAPLAGTALVGGMMLLSALSQLYVFTSYYA
jgi:4-amino-4-deoxy-L-arabinose transferase-like glycosyltransferase